MNPAAPILSILVLTLAAPLTVSIERRVKAWVQMRRGPSLLQPYRDLRRLWAKAPLEPATASPAYRYAPLLGLAVLVAAATTLPVWNPQASLGGPAALIVFSLLLALDRFLRAAQAYDTGTAFGGLGASRELFLGGLGEPVLILGVAGIALLTGSARVPDAPLDPLNPATWLIVASLVLLWISKTARIPFDNPATHLELTMVHEAMVLEASGWQLACQELAAALKQTLMGALIVLLVIPVPVQGPARVAALAASVIALSACLAAAESGIAKLRLFRASHLLLMGAFLAFFGGAVTLLSRGA